MKQLIFLAKKHNPDNPFAAMIINSTTNEVLCTGVNQVFKNPIYHGEVVAINTCVKRFDNKVDWHNTTLITTAEPCPMCMAAIIWTGISKVVYGTSMKTLSKYGGSVINIPSNYMLSVQDISKTSMQGGILSNETDKLYKYLMR